MLKNNIIMKKEEDFDNFKFLLSEDAKMDQRECYLSESVPHDYPCLVKLIQMDDVDLQITMDENDDFNPLTEREQKVINDESHGVFYDFIFITQTEIKKLLEA